MGLSRTHLQLLHQESATYVLVHASWRKRRGKSPTVPYAGIQNPVLAYELALAIFENMQDIEECYEEGRRLIEQGVTYRTATGPELCRMIRFVVESSQSPADVRCMITTMLDAPEDAILEVITTTTEQCIAEFKNNCYPSDERESPYLKRIIESVKLGLNPSVVHEIFRSGGGLATEDGTFIVLSLRDAMGNIYTF